MNSRPRDPYRILRRHGLLRQIVEVGSIVTCSQPRPGESADDYRLRVGARVENRVAEIVADLLEPEEGP